MPVCGACRCRPVTTGAVQDSAPRPFAPAAPRLLLALTAAPVGLRPMRMCVGGTWPARPCSPLAAPLVWRELQDHGYAHGPKMVQKWVAENRTRPASRTPRKWLQDAPASAVPGTASGPGPALPSPKQLAWLLLRPATTLSPLDAAAVRRVEQDREATQVASLARRFTALVRECGAGQPTRPVAPAADLDTWLAEARTCAIGAVETFAAGLEQDSAAVRAALTEPWSSGQAEGQINRLEMLKRQSYGRASFDLLRRRVLIAA